MVDIGAVTRVAKIIEYIGLGLTVVAGGSVVAMILLTGLDVAGRFVFNRPVPGTFELTEYITVAVALLPLAYVQARRSHIRADVLTTRLSQRWQAGFTVFAFVLGLVAWSAISWYGLKATVEAWKVGEYAVGLIEFPLWVPKMLVPVGGFGLCLQLAIDILRDLRLVVRKPTG